MRILVYGAGNMGCLYAALLQESGQDVSVLARGTRLADIRDHGIRLQDVEGGGRTTSRVNAVERLEPEDRYDLVLVILPKTHVSEVLPVLAANHHAPNVMFFGNNAAGPREMVDALGRDRVLLGFPGAAAVTRDRVIRYLITSKREQPTTIGELDGARSARIQAIADALGTAGFPVAVSANMDAWLKTHVAEISPTVNALYMAGGDARRLARTRDALVLMLRAIREGYRVLSALGIPILPGSHRVFRWLPEPLLLVVMRRVVEDEWTAIKIGHAAGAREEMGVLAHEFRELTRRTEVPTPAIDALDRYLDPHAEPIPDGSRRVPVRWRSVWTTMILLTVVGSLWALLPR
jgi:2-dehydropantoate 2-reductase